MTEKVLSIESQEHLFERFKKVALTINSQIESKYASSDEDTPGSGYLANWSTTDEEMEICMEGENLLSGDKELVTLTITKDSDGIKLQNVLEGEYSFNALAGNRYSRKKDGPLTQNLTSELITDFAEQVGKITPAEYSFERITALICGTELSEFEHDVMTPYDKAEALAARL